MSERLVYPVLAVLLLGPTGSGKSPLGDLLAERGFLGFASRHLDFGSELRLAITPERSPQYSPPELSFLKDVLERGLLLENEHFSLAQKIISLFLERARFTPDMLLVLNGIPRHTGQANDIASIASILALVVLDCSPDSVYCRLHRNTGGDRTGRTDDHRGLVSRKLELYRERTEPLIDHYSRTGSRIFRIPVDEHSSPEETYARLSSLSSADPPLPLVSEPPQR